MAAGALALLAGCTAGGASDDGDQVPRATASLPPPVGSIAHPRPVRCVEGTIHPLPSTSGTSAKSGAPNATPAGPPASRNDVSAGALIWHGAAALATGDQKAHGVQNADGWHYRVDSEVWSSQQVTVTIGPDQRARAGLQYGIGYGMSPAPAVTFHGCPGAATVFIGAFFVAGDGRACVPLDVRAGDGPPRRVVISFFDGRCPA
ncbi:MULTISPECIES: hypothetical protein [unclassified Streptomyces]|uniref:hypothetical protein n=1 Tax=unclassified Streptomyces TaxID=2593676 RepID=UPI000B82CAB8|nr:MULTISPECIES: hypothetical protein [unclassified Streptomyces]MYS24025.1 hypothetical protein [Streptomyces sp. SID4948]